MIKHSFSFELPLHIIINTQMYLFDIDRTIDGKMNDEFYQQ